MHLLDQFLADKTRLFITIELAADKIGGTRALRNALGITQSTMWRYRHAKACPRMDIMKKLAKIAKVSVSWVAEAPFATPEPMPELWKTLEE